MRPSCHRTTTRLRALRVLLGALTIAIAAPAFAADPNIVGEPLELIFSSLSGQSTAAEPLIVRNTGTAPLTITSLTLVGTNPTQFQLVSPPSVPFTVGAAAMTTLNVRFSPTIVGSLSAFLRIGSNDPDTSTFDTGLYGLSAQGLEGSNEPPLHRVVTTLGHAINVGGTNLSLGTGAGPIGDEVLAPLFEKAFAGNVVMIPVARYSPAFVLRFGYYANGTPQSRNEVGQLSGSSNPPEHQTLFPALVNGGTTFDPGLQAFGLYSTSPSHTAYSQDAVNALLHPSNVVHAVRAYPLKNRVGVPIPNAYLIGFEEASNGDYQDYVFTLHNVRPAGSGVDGDGDGVLPPSDCNDSDPLVFPGAAELCDGRDNDCDVIVDEGNPQAGGPCDTGAPGPCALGTSACQSGSLACIPDSAPSVETCNGIDDNCDGIADNGNPGGGSPCTTGLGGICEPGNTVCENAALACVAVSSAQPESCNGSDDDCDGSIDEGNPGGGLACDSGQPGPCSAATLHCVDAALVCLADVVPETEMCANNADDDCDGDVDEIADCLLCTPSDTTESTAQTRRNKIKRKSSPGSSRAIVKGEYVMPSPGISEPDAEDITLHMEDEAGVYYAAALPAGVLEKSRNGRSFTYKASSEPFVYDGLRRAKLAIRSDLVTVRYVFAAENLTLPSFAGSQSRTSVKLGGRCYTDVDDACMTNGDGTATSCR